MFSSLSQGNASHILSNVKATLFSKTGAIILFVIVLLMIAAYYLTRSNPTFKANREGEAENTDSNKIATLMIFSVDWCPHCKTAMPEWKSLEEDYANKQINGYTLMFQEYNCTEETTEIEELIAKYKIEGYPTIKLIKDNQVIEYDAKPNKATMETFLNTVV